MPESQLAERPETVRDFLALPAYKARFGEVLGNRAPQFMASLIQLTNDPYLARCEPKSVIASAMIAAILDFPIEKSLGFAHIVPYGGVAQFQMAAKGYVQLALRSGQYQRLNAKPVNAEAVGSYDEVGEPEINWSLLDETKPAVGYVVAWKLVNGFVKRAYWSRAKVEAHAAQFSQAYKKKKTDSPWFTNFDKMAIKTVLMNELRTYGPLSVQMQTAMKHDMAAHTDIDAEPQYIDNSEQPTGAVVADEPAVQRPPAPPRVKKGAAAVVENASTQTEAERRAAEKGVKIVEGDFTEVPKVSAADLAQFKLAEKEEAQLQADLAAREAKLKATQPKPQSTPHDPAPKPAGEVKPAQPGEQATPIARAFLKDGEEIVVTATVKDLGAMMGNYAKVPGTPPVPTPLVQLEVAGEFTGRLWHWDGGTADAAKKVTPNPLYVPGAVLRFTLLGKLNNAAKPPKIVNLVQKVEAVEEPAESQPVEMG